jgi:hypothetical protein
VSLQPYLNFIRITLFLLDNNIMHYEDFQAGWVVLKSSGGERARFLAEGSEPRNKLRLMDLWNKSIGSSKGGKSPLVAGQSPRKNGVGRSAG